MNIYISEKRNNKNIKLYFADHELILRTGDLLSAPTDVIVNPANGGLSHGGGLAEQILNAAGKDLEEESNAYIKKYGYLASGMTTFTTAGHLPYKAVIHAVGPRMGEGHEMDKIAQAVKHSLELCDDNNWQSIAFPAISTGIFSVPVEICARGFQQAITSFWKSSTVKSPDKIFIYLSENSLNIFASIFGFIDTVAKNQSPNTEKEIETGHITLSEEEITDLDNDEMKDWFQ